MRNLALSAIIAMVVSVIVFHTVTEIGVDTFVAALAAVVAARAVTFVAVHVVTIAATATVAAVFVVAFAATFAFVGGAAALVAPVATTPAIMIIMVALATIVVAIAALISAITVIVVAKDLMIPYRWAFGVYVVQGVTLLGVFLRDNILFSAITTVVGCGMVVGIWWLYNRYHQPAFVAAKGVVS